MTSQLTEQSGVRLAIEGCGHGTLHAIYASVEESCKQKGWPGIDLLIICGDFQAVRNAYDLNCVSMPAKYREMCDFHEYYSGQRTAPYLTVFIGGNHEASNYLSELYYGGWVAPNIYYMGAANVLKFGPLRIASLSGIWKGYDYRKPHYERLPYNESDKTSIFHVREVDVRKLLQIRTQVDIGISHDWPKGIENKGNTRQLFRFKPFLESDSMTGRLGSVAAKEAMDHLRPRYWFSAHLHCKFAARVDYGEERTKGSEAKPSQNPSSMMNENGPMLPSAPTDSNEVELDLSDDGDETKESKSNFAAVTNDEEIDLDIDDADGSRPAKARKRDDEATTVPNNGDSETQHPSLSTSEARAALPDSFRRPAERKPPRHPPQIANQTTDFLALSKCIPSSHFLQLLEVPNDSKEAIARPLKLEYDREWLAIVRSFQIDEPLTVGNADAAPPPARSQEEYEEAIDKHREWIDRHISGEDLLVPENFQITAPVYDGGDWNQPEYAQAKEYPNPQTEQFCVLLQMPNPLEISDVELQQRQEQGPVEDPRAEKSRSWGANSRGGRNHRGGGYGGNHQRGGGYRGGRGEGHRGRGGRNQGRYRNR